MAGKDDARDADAHKDEAGANAKAGTAKADSAKAGAAGTDSAKANVERTTSKGTAPGSLDDFDLTVTEESEVTESHLGEDDDAPAGEDAKASADLDEVPFELAEDRPDPEDLPETGLVSEFVDVNKRQAAWLVTNRESSTAMRSSLFLVTVAVIVLGIVAAIVSGIVRDAQAESGTPTMAMVGVGEQAAMYEQQLGVKITDVEDAQAAEALVRNGTVDAAFIQDPTGQAQPTIIALDKQPTALLEKLAPQTEATLLQTPAVPEDIATPMLWGMVVFSLLVIATLGTALYQNLRLEKRNRITEIIAATIPPRAAASGRVTGMLTLVVIHVVVAAVIVELGLSISGQTGLAFSMLPGLGWFALTLFFTAWTVFGLLVWASTLTGDRARHIAVAVIGVLTVGGAFAPVIIGASGTVAKVLSWTPFTSPLGIAGRFFSAAPEWWEGLVAAAIAALLAVIVHAIAGGAYVRSVLSGGGRGGRTVKLSKRAQKVAAAQGASSAGADDAAESSKADASDDADDAEAADDSEAVDVVEVDTADADAEVTADADDSATGAGAAKSTGPAEKAASASAKDAKKTDTDSDAT